MDLSGQPNRKRLFVIAGIIAAGLLAITLIVIIVITAIVPSLNKISTADLQSALQQYGKEISTLDTVFQNIKNDDVSATALFVEGNDQLIADYTKKMSALSTVIADYDGIQDHPEYEESFACFKRLLSERAPRYSSALELYNGLYAAFVDNDTAAIEGLRLNGEAASALTKYRTNVKAYNDSYKQLDGLGCIENPSSTFRNYNACAPLWATLYAKHDIISDGKLVHQLFAEIVDPIDYDEDTNLTQAINELNGIFEGNNDAH